MLLIPHVVVRPKRPMKVRCIQFQPHSGKVSKATSYLHSKEMGNGRSNWSAWQQWQREPLWLPAFLLIILSSGFDEVKKEAEAPFCTGCYYKIQKPLIRLT